MTISEQLDDSQSSMPAVPLDDSPTRRHEVIQREHKEFGGIKFGTGLLGWLATTGTTVILALAATGGWMSVAANETADAPTLGVDSAIAVLVIVFVAHFSGGYVAGRMSRFDGAKQGLAVWLWSIIVVGFLVLVLPITTALTGNQFDPLGSLTGIRGVPLITDQLIIAGIVTVVLALGVSLAAALLGGIAGIRFTHKVDRRVERVGPQRV